MQRTIAAALAVLAACLTLGTSASASQRHPDDPPPCGTSFTDLNPAPGEQLGITYRNCWVSGTFTPFQTNGSVTWVYQQCKGIAADAWDSWTVTTPSYPVNFGVGTCDGQSTHPQVTKPTYDPYNPKTKWTQFNPSNPGPGGYVHQYYYNLDVDALVAAAYRTTSGDWGFYLHDGCLSVPGPKPTAAWISVGNWDYYAPQVPANLKTVFCI